MRHTSPSQRIGGAAESYVCHFLKQQGLRLIEKNFQCKTGEIDLIMKEAQTLVFVEVRYRQNLHFGHCLESIDPMKQNKLLKTAFFYLQKNRFYEKYPCRFDIIGVTAPLQAANITWIKNAFGT